MKRFLELCTKKGCYFHFYQATFRKVPASRHQQHYQNSANVRSFIRSLAALAFLPLDNVNNAFLLLSEEQEELYFRQTWIKGWPLHRWNVRNLGNRMNNSVEGCHNRFATVGGNYHSHLWKLLEVLQKE